MPNQTGRVTHKSTFVVRENLPGSALPASLLRQIGEVLEELPDKPALAGLIERSLHALGRRMAENDVSAAAAVVCALLSLELDDLRKAALLSLIVRWTGKRKFDPIASYILQNREVFVTARG